MIVPSASNAFLGLTIAGTVLLVGSNAVALILMLS
jgi:hypothetical protein